MRAHILQHVPFEGLGSIESWLKKSGFKITSTRFYESAKLPDLKTIDLLVVMGGPMSVNDEDRFPWLVAEKQFIWDAIAKSKPVLGICLGAQLIASALGAGVYPNKVKEIGWFPIHGIESSANPFLRFRSPSAYSTGTGRRFICSREQRLWQKATLRTSGVSGRQVGYRSSVSLGNDARSSTGACYQLPR
jgi:GMP synthase-like glutamine amidotransferase